MKRRGITEAVPGHQRQLLTVARYVHININDIKIINIYDFSLISIMQTFIYIYLVTHGYLYSLSHGNCIYKSGEKQAACC